MSEQVVLQGMAEAANANMVQKQATSATYTGAFTSYGAADAFGVPAEIIESLIQPSGLLDLFDLEFDNRPVLPFDMFTTKEGTDDGSFAEGGCPTGTTSVISRFTEAARSWGSCSDHLTLVALASKQHLTPSPRRVRTKTGPVTLTSEWEFQMFKVLQRARRIQEYLIINGDPTVNPHNFNGLLNRIIRENHTDINGVVQVEADSTVHEEGCTSVTIRKIEEVIGALEDRYVDPSDIVMVMRPGLFRHLAYQISLEYMDIGAKHQALLRGRTLPLAGVDIPVTTTQWLPRTGSAQSWCSSILFLTFTYLGLPSLYLQAFDFSNVVANLDIFSSGPAGAGGLTPSPYVMFTRDRTGSEGLCTAAEFCIWAHGRVVALAPQSLGKIEDVSYSALRERTVTNP